MHRTFPDGLRLAELPVKTAELDGFGDVLCPDILRTAQVCDRSGYPQNSVVRPSTQPEIVDGQAQQRPCLLG